MRLKHPEGAHSYRPAVDFLFSQYVMSRKVSKSNKASNKSHSKTRRNTRGAPGRAMYPSPEFIEAIEEAQEEHESSSLVGVIAGIGLVVAGGYTLMCR